MGQRYRITIEDCNRLQKNCIFVSLKNIIIFNFGILAARLKGRKT